MTEQTLEIQENNGFKNLNLKPKLHKGIKGLDNGNHVVVNKLFKDGLEKTGQYGKFYIIKALYQDQEVSFMLSEKEHTGYRDCGEIGDNIQILLSKESVVNKKTGVEMVYNKLNFERV